MPNRTIPAWPIGLFEAMQRTLQRYKTINIYVSHEYFYSLTGPLNTDICYFKIKLKTS